MMSYRLLHAKRLARSRLIYYYNVTLFMIFSWFIASDGVSRLGLGLETCLETHFLESRSRRSQVSSWFGLEGFRSRSRALRLETLRGLFFMKFCK